MDQPIKPTVEILVTCRKEELIPAAEMVFKTIRKGFPLSRITAYLNHFSDSDFHNQHWFDGVFDLTREAGIMTDTSLSTIHHEWISTLLTRERPFFLLDTDVVFWDSFEQFDFSGQRLAGRFIPRFRDKFTNCITEPRYHTSLLYMNPVAIREALKEYQEKFPVTPFNPLINPINPIIVPSRGLSSRFYDTTSLLYNIIGGCGFSTVHLDAYSHLNFGTISDIVAPFYPELRFREKHFAAFENPEFIRGSWREQDQFYKAHAI